MPNELWFLIPAVGSVLAVGTIPLAGWLAGKVRRPCPHCGRRTSRTIQAVETGPGGLRPRSLTYRCQSCGGAMRYARRPTGQEFWEPIVEPADRSS